MSSKIDKLNKLIDDQQAILDSVKAEARSISADDVYRENEELKSKIDILAKSESNLKAENDSLKKSLDNTKAALFSKAADEKLSAFSSVQNRIEKVYYKKELGIGSVLDDYERNCIKSIDDTVKVIEGYGSSQFDDILANLKALRAETQARRARLEEYKNTEFNNAVQTNFAVGESYKNAPLTEAEKQAATKQRSIESFIGLNVLGKAGILLFIIGIIMLGRFAYVHMSDVFKGGLIYLLGIVLVAVGELFYKKEKTVFSTTLISGGVATLYAAAATCFFAFELYNAKVTFIICVLITAAAVILSNQVKSQVVCAFGAVGGYLPVVAIYMMGFGKAAADVTFLPVSSVYFCLLAIILFAMTYNKKWYVAQFIGYGLHLIAIGGIAKCAYSLRNLTGYGYALPLAVAFAVVSFVIYLMMPGAKIVKGKPFLVKDGVLLGLNTVSGAVSVSVTVHNLISNSTKADRTVGFVFLVFTLIYAFLSAFAVKEKRESSAVATAITSISGLAFSMFIVPFIFGAEYASIGWAAEGIIIALIGIQKKIDVIEYAGLGCMIMSVAARIFGSSEMSKELAAVSFAVIVCAFWIYTVRGFVQVEQRSYKTVIYTAVEIVSAYSSVGLVKYLYDNVMSGPSVKVNSVFNDYAVVIASLLVFSIIIRHGLFKNRASMLVSDLVSFGVFLTTFVGMDIHNKYNEIFSYFGEIVEHNALMVINVVLLFAVNIGVILFLASAVLDIINRFAAPAWLFTMAISLSSLMLITAIAMGQFEVKFSNVIISALYIAASCIMLFVGFKRRYTVVRSGGLVLILCAFAKLCFVDTSHLDSGWKIASYFAFGAILILISYFYQRFSKKAGSEVENINK
ncbi:DUF2339 domain-containing protein [uncultured Eubacterium sp.]|uniref:DUF2339 domain-containing protein n=1 Tax=uncultured Eubacterium sp. TaxID=165185 RepID=UPI0025FFE48E|nr:DUF2339 domain-containing protein [uncultured Eubacterium sp.]